VNKEENDEEQIMGYSTIPHIVIDSGLWARMKPFERSFYGVLYRYRNYKTELCFQNVTTKGEIRMRLLTVKETAKILSISEKTLYQWHWLEKNVPFVKVGRTLRVSAEDLSRFIEAGKKPQKKD